MKVFTIAEMVAAEKEADAAAQNHAPHGITYAQMMENAGKTTAQAIMERLLVQGKRVLVLVGPGNNGGDGLVCGRVLADAGADVTFYLSNPRDPESDPNLAQVQEMGLNILRLDFDQRYRLLRLQLNGVDIVVDALLGTGVSRPISGELAKLLRQVRAGIDERGQIIASQRRTPLTHLGQIQPVPPANGPLIVAIDCPSGLNCDTGELDPLALPAHLTVTFAAAKRGHFIFPGASACGELVVADIGIAPDLPTPKGVTLEVATVAMVRPWLPARPRDGHKGTFGKVLIAAGSEPYWGAPLLAGKAAFRAGAGLVALLLPDQIRPTAVAHLPEATYPYRATADVLDAAAAHHLLTSQSAYKAILIGPGLSPAATAFMDTLFPATDQPPVTSDHSPPSTLHSPLSSPPPLLLDADALNILATWPDWWSRLPAHSILTPHPGEMARLMGVSLDKLKGMDRVTVAKRFAAAWGHIVLLKGAYTVVAAPDGRCTLLPFANPILGVGGSGDVLAGVIVALLGQGVPRYAAAVLGGYLHGLAGQLASQEHGDSGLLASELADYLPAARRILTNLH
ncbi:MAG: NAD(P)H-hydrate dehydratase [Chloroflexi bacterium]|nr:NAD(P)H-hydrate dehydratase [Chloroflexota bacterium]